MNPPDNILLSYNLYPKGTIEIGYESYKGGMSVGTTRIVARIQIPEDCGTYPDGWFPIHNSFFKIKREFEEQKLRGEELFCIPKSIALDCYSYHWEVLWREKNEKNSDTV